MKTIKKKIAAQIVAKLKELDEKTNLEKKKLATKIVTRLNELDENPRSDFKGGDVTREQMAREAGVSRTTFFNALKGECSFENMVKVATYFEIELLVN